MSANPSMFVCLCGMSFGDNEAFQKHVAEVHPKPELFRCLMCIPKDQPFYSLYDYLQHMAWHTQQWENIQLPTLPPMPAMPAMGPSTSTAVSYGNDHRYRANQPSVSGLQGLPKFADFGQLHHKALGMVSSAPAAQPILADPFEGLPKFGDGEIRQRHHDLTALLGGKRYLNKARSYTCEICNQNPLDPAAHVMAHLTREGHKPYYCKICKKPYVTRAAGLHHLKMLHYGFRSPQEEAELIRDRRFVMKQKIKEMTKNCFPSSFVDARLPAILDLLQLKYGAHEIDIMDEPLEGKELAMVTSAPAAQPIPADPFEGLPKFADSEIRQHHHDVTALLGGKRYLNKSRSYTCEICHHDTLDPVAHVMFHLTKEGHKPYYCKMCRKPYVTRAAGQHYLKMLHYGIRSEQEEVELIRDRRYVMKEKIKGMTKSCYPSLFVDARLPEILDLLLLKNEAPEVDLVDQPLEG